MDNSWIVDNLTNALNTWNDKLGEIWQLLTVSPVSYNGGAVWSVMTGIYGALQAIAYGLLVLFFAAGVVKTCGSFAEVRRPEQALKLFVRFALAKAAVDYGLDLMLAVFDIVQGDGRAGHRRVGRKRYRWHHAAAGAHRHHQRLRLLGRASRCGR